MEQIRYLDHYKMTERVSQHDIDDANPVIMQDTGDVLRETENLLWLAPTVVDFGTDEIMYDGVHCIVKGAILERKAL